MIRSVPAWAASHYLNTMGFSYLFNGLFTLLVFGGLPTPFLMFIITIITDFGWWANYKRHYD